MVEASLNVFINDEWMGKHLNEIKRKAGPRYTPELHIELPIVEIFEGISRTLNFYRDIRKHYGNLIRDFRIISKYEVKDLQEIYGYLDKELNNIFELLESIKEYNTAPIPWNKISKFAKSAQSLIWKLIDELRRYKETIKEKKENTSLSPREKVEGDIRHLFKVQEKLQYFIELASSKKGELCNHPFLLLTGKAGIGKTHLLCDIVSDRINNNFPAILIFGEFFKDGVNIWQQIIKQLNLPVDIDSKEKFLILLNEIGERSKCRSLLIIDALNETIPPNFWKKNLKEIIEEIKKYPNIALVISIRSGFEEEVLTEGLKKEFIEEKHQGFAFKEWEAVTKFFNEFSLPLPEVPLLTPEFQNPLFLLLFCKAFQKRKGKDKQIFRGHEGFTYIFENYVDSVARTIEDEFGIPHAPKKNIWDTVIEKIAGEMVNHNTDRISEEELTETIKSFHPIIEINEFIKSLDRNLLLVKVPRYSKDFKKVEGYDFRFPFQKFSDHLIVRYLLKKCKAEKKKPEDFFAENTPIAKFLRHNYGLIEALSIQCPEWFRGKDLFEVAPYLKDSFYIHDAFVEGLIWRRPDAFSKETIKKIARFLKEKVLESVLKQNEAYDDYFIYPDFTYKLLDALLSVASIPEHPLNADFLHEHLMKFSMSKRDTWFSTFLHYQHGERNAVERIIEWSWSEYDKSHINDKSILLLSTALAWFSTTPNRFIRDKSTKALVSLLQQRIHLLPELLDKFKGIDDLYVSERLFTVAYGCALRSRNDQENLGKLAKWVYDNVFKDNKPPVHILLRDYARGIIEVALRRGIKLEIEEDKINPPYKSNWPEHIPSDDEIRKYEFDYESKDFKDYYRSQNAIISSMQPEHSTISMYGDFGRYVFQRVLSSWDTNEIPMQQLSNLAVKVIFDEIGYNVELHGKFDRNIVKHDHGRTGHKSERIGKKYQWIAFHEISALVSDCFSLKKEPLSDNRTEYKGPWMPHVRDIDPSLLIRNGNHLKESVSLKNWLSTNGRYEAWAKEKESTHWLKTENDLPDPAGIILITDDDGQEWSVLEGLIRCEEDTPPEHERYEIPIREFWYMINSYIIKKEDLNRILEWAKGRNFWGKWMPESHEFYEIFLGEYPGSLAFKDLKGNYNIWTKEGGLPAPVIVTDDIYLNEFTYDCSCDKAISIKLPSKWLVDKMRLSQLHTDGRWFNEKEELIALPIFEEEPLSSLLFKKGTLFKFLEEDGYAIFWTLLGEKRLIGGDLTHQDYKGHLIINGIYTIDSNHNVVGLLNTKFEK